MQTIDNNNTNAVDYIVIGQIGRAHGIRGAVRVTPLTDDPSRYKLLKEIYIEINSIHQSFEIERVQFQNQYILLTLKGIETRNDAEKMRGMYVEIPKTECLPLKEGQHYYFELIGLKVNNTTGEMIGIIDDIISYPANDILVVRNNDKEYLIPAVDSFIKNIDIESGLMTIDPIEGLLE